MSVRRRPATPRRRFAAPTYPVSLAVAALVAGCGGTPQSEPKSGNDPAAHQPQDGREPDEMYAGDIAEPFEEDDTST